MEVGATAGPAFHLHTLDRLIAYLDTRTSTNGKLSATMIFKLLNVAALGKCLPDGGVLAEHAVPSSVSAGCPVHTMPLLLSDDMLTFEEGAAARAADRTWSPELAAYPMDWVLTGFRFKVRVGKLLSLQSTLD